MDSWKVKTGIIGGVILLVSALVVLIWYQNNTIQRLKVIETSVVAAKQISDEVMRAQASYATKEDLETIIEEQVSDFDDIKKDLRKLGADVDAINTVTVISSGYSGSNIPSSNSTDNPVYVPSEDGSPLIDIHGYTKTTEWLTLKEPFSDTSVPLGKVGFSAFNEHPWSLELYPREYQSTTVLGKDEEGRSYAYSTFQINVNGQKYTLPVTDAKIVQKYPSPKFRFNPRLYLGVDGFALMNKSTGELTPNIGLSLFSLGSTKLDTTWSFATIGLGYETQEKTGAIIVAPVNYNVGKHLPLITDFHLGPSMSLDFSGNWGLGVGGRVRF